MTLEPHARADNFWDRSKLPRAVAPPLAGDIAVDVAIIGAGYTGLATAYHLKAADPSLDVAILESLPPGSVTDRADVVIVRRQKHGQ